MAGKKHDLFLILPNISPLFIILFKFHAVHTFLIQVSYYLRSSRAQHGSKNEAWDQMCPAAYHLGGLGQLIEPPKDLVSTSEKWE